ncbi:putative LRR receptor-like serine/threonine-protein kinase [Capsicum chacoense]|uniref:LRR receptor-like serine/threonine-protein kinase n=1 Tax=Capsicum annuum TaxID=4072 RepID=A0A1U8E012_CAPAN|nr:probable LRR receptor-like serine/threonine-protein kinase At2g16250 [Capsicum annuum]KAF3657101.1 putative LRR receptor-like serine/threonine-protein kinase [Capsicum annuum]PHT62113.1 putative LRR receptor-like serine/threonine-protein kinase [Capsicum annuum]
MVERKGRVVLFCFVFLLFIECTFEQRVVSSVAEKFALLQLRSSLGLRAKEWPIKGNPCVNWVGIVCKNGRVVGINISGFKRTRVGSQTPKFSVDALQNLTPLESFNASNFALPDSIPEWFGVRLVSLRVLDLSSCAIIGPIPPSLGNLTSLVTLNLSNNGLTGQVPITLRQLSRLSTLDLSRNKLVGVIPNAFGLFPNLTVLDMSSNFLSGAIPPEIGSLVLLKSVNLSDNSLSSLIPTQLGNLSNLVNLDLSSNSLSGVVPELGGLRNLQRMAVEKNRLSGSLPVALWSMPGLQFLDASANNFTGILPNVSSIVNATSAVFNLSHNMFYGNLPSLNRSFSFLDLSGNYFQGKLPDYARRNVSINSNCLQNVTSQRSRSECASFYSERGLPFDNFGEPNATEPLPAPKSNKKSHRNVIILAAVLGGVGLLVLVLTCMLLLVFCTRKRGATNQRATEVGPGPASASPPPPVPGVSLNFSSLGDAFTYQQILQATGEFSDANLMKHGHSGDLFRGSLEGGTLIVVKRVNVQSARNEAYLSELDFFSKVSHSRLVPFMGHCLENENEKFVVYKYMPNRDLSSSLFRKNNSDDDSLQSLDWITRLKIAIGAAEGLSYLHHECNPPLVHRDVQASSILLDDKFEVRLGSLNEACAHEGESHQNRISRLLRLPQTSEQGASGTPSATCAYDVYCFGKVLLELVTGKLGFSASNDASMKEWLDGTLKYISIYDKELVTNIVDPSLIIDEDLLEEVWAMAIVARSCLNPKPSRRPLMRYILKALENPLKVVREEHTSSARLRATSSRSSWNAALFGSWRSSSDVAAVPAAASAHKLEGTSSLKQSGTTGSQGSGPNGDKSHSSSTRRQSKEIFPEPLEEQDVERPHEG